MPVIRRHLLHSLLALLSVLGGCGGGSGGGGADTSTAPAPTAFPPSATLENLCTVSDEQRFIRAYLDETYLWYREIPAVDATLHANVLSYFYALLVSTPDASGQPRDRFSYVISSRDADALATGLSVGYGVEWRQDELGRQRVAYVTAGSPADAAGLRRGGQLVQLQASNIESWYPNAEGAWRQFLYSDTPGGAARSITLHARAVQEDPVPVTKVLSSAQGRRIGYLLFNDHALGAQDRLIDAVRSLQTQGVDDLVLDMRYNSGGYLYVAQTLASMISGAQANGQVFEALHFNDKRAADSAANIFRFTGTLERGESIYTPGYGLPRLNLRRVYLLSGTDTCSASESVINGLRGIDIEVILVGSRTCGKPYGFRRKNNCGHAYHAVEFSGSNAKGYADYASGFAPSCGSSDDFSQALGAAQEGQLATALHHIEQGRCPGAAALAASLPPRSIPDNGSVLPEPRRPPHGKWLRAGAP